MTKLIIANWKANHHWQSAKHWLQELADFRPQLATNQSEIVLAPPAPLLAAVAERLAEQQLQLTLAAQDISQFGGQNEAYTGEIQPANLSGLGVKYVILGHSERRRFLGETYLEVAAKVQSALSAGMTPIVAVDEPDFIPQLSLIPTAVWPKMILAYEPVAAIGTGLNLAVAELSSVLAKIKKIAPQTQVIYGGSVNSQNVADYLSLTAGVLVGGASLAAADFKKLIIASQSLTR